MIRIIPILDIIMMTVVTLIITMMLILVQHITIRAIVTHQSLEIVSLALHIIILETGIQLINNLFTINQYIPIHLPNYIRMIKLTFVILQYLSPFIENLFSTNLITRSQWYMIALKYQLNQHARGDAHRAPSQLRSH